MSNDNVIKLIQPGTFTDHLTEILRNGACALLTQAVEAEVAEFLTKHADLKTGDGHRRVVRHGHLPKREIMTGIGPVAVRQPRNLCPLDSVLAQHLLHRAVVRRRGRTVRLFSHESCPHRRDSSTTG